MKRYPCEYGELFTPDGAFALDGEYVPAEVAERLYEALNRMLEESVSSDARPSLQAMIDADKALKFADGETPTT